MGTNRISQYLKTPVEPSSAGPSPRTDSFTSFATMPGASPSASPDTPDVYRMAWEQAQESVRANRQLRNRIAQWLDPN